MSVTGRDCAEIGAGWTLFILIFDTEICLSVMLDPQVNLIRSVIFYTIRHMAQATHIVRSNRGATHINLTKSWQDKLTGMDVMRKHNSHTFRLWGNDAEGG